MLFVAASGAGDAFRPAERHCVLMATIGIREEYDGFLKCLWGFDSALYTSIVRQVALCVK